MARTAQTTWIVTDDLTGETLTEEEASSVEFSYGGVTYQIDLGPKNLKKLDDFLGEYIEKARRVRNGGNTPPKAKKAPKYDLDAVRAWASKNGHKVAERGRIAQSVLAAYDAAN